MSFLITTDLHLTDRPQDECRWSLFDRIEGLASEVEDLTHVLILGDITDHKDRHSSVLVNRIVERLTRLTERGLTVYLMKGNHDYVDPSQPFFAMLSAIPGLTFISAPVVQTFGEPAVTVLFLPHTRTPQTDWGDIDVDGLSRFDFVFLHQTFENAKAANGERLAGLPSELFDANTRGTVLSGDIHIPQRVGNVEYVGAPYHCNFGDPYTPRVLLFEGNRKRREINWEFPRKLVLTIKEPADIRRLVKGRSVRPGDQAKIVLRTGREDAVNWTELRRQIVEVCTEVGVTLYSAKVELTGSDGPDLAEGRKALAVRASTPQQDFERFLEAEKIDGLVAQIGRALMEDPTDA